MEQALTMTATRQLSRRVDVERRARVRVKGVLPFDLSIAIPLCIDLQGL
jgi:hypothetical protein